MQIAFVIQEILCRILEITELRQGKGHQCPESNESKIDLNFALFCSISSVENNMILTRLYAF